MTGRYEPAQRGALYDQALQANLGAPQGAYNHPWISPGPLYRAIGGQWLWDLAYTGWAVARVGGRPDLARGFVRSAVTFREATGPDRGRLLHAPGTDGRDPALIEGTSQTPLLCWLTARLHALEPDEAFVREVYRPLAEWIAWWRSARRDVDGDGLSEYAGPTAKAALHESGIDVGPNKDPIFLAPPAPGPDGLVHDPLADVTLNAVLHAECLALAELAAVAAPDEVDGWRAEAARIKGAMQALMWDEHVGAFLPCLRRDLDPQQRRYCRITPLVALPLWAGVADEGQNHRTIALLRGDPTAFPTHDGELAVVLGTGAPAFGGVHLTTTGLHPAVTDGDHLTGVVPAAGTVRSEAGWCAAAGGDLLTMAWPRDRMAATVWFNRLEVGVDADGPVEVVVTDGDGVTGRYAVGDGPVEIGGVSGPPASDAPLHGLREVRLRALADEVTLRGLVLRWSRPERHGLLTARGVRSAHPLDGKHPAPGAPTHFWSGTVWAPYCYHVAHALRSAGEELLARAVATGYCDTVMELLRLGAPSPEHFSADTGAAMGAVPVAWTGAVALLLMEEALGEPPLGRPVPGDGSSADESTWLADLGRKPAATVVAPGLTAGEVFAFHRRPPTPAGADYRPGVAYATRPTGGAPDAPVRTDRRDRTRTRCGVRARWRLELRQPGEVPARCGAAGRAGLCDGLHRLPAGPRGALARPA